MRPSNLFTETKAIWGHLPLLARYAVGGVVLGAVGYLMHRIGLDEALPRDMRYRPPHSQDLSWHRDHSYRHHQHGNGYHSHRRTKDEWRR